MRWRLADRTLDLARPRGAGIVNVTVDSMFEGARSGTPEQAVRDGLALAEGGLEMLDVGAVAGKRGAAVPPQEEPAALVPAIEGLIPALPRRFQTFAPYGGHDSGNDDALPVSADTFSVEVARQAVGAGAARVNDISGGCEEMFE